MCDWKEKAFAFRKSLLAVSLYDCKTSTMGRIKKTYRAVFEGIRKSTNSMRTTPVLRVE